MNHSLAEHDVAETAATYATNVSVDDLPEDVRGRLSLVLLDTIGVCIRGSQTPYVAEVLHSATRLGRNSPAEGGATVFATGDRCDVSLAAMLNAAAGTTLELDEGNQRTAHPGIHTVTPAVAAAEHLEATGRELMDAVLAGYEVGARLGDVIRPMKDGLHPHGGWAPVSAAVAVGRLLDFDVGTMTDAIRNAVTPFLVGHWRAALDGATIRNFYTGLSCEHGINAAMLADSGVTGVSRSIEECLLPYTAKADVSDELLSPFTTFGDEFYLTSSYVKVHAACRYTHAPIEALEEILKQSDFAPHDVDSIEVKTFELGTMLSRTDPENVLSAKFSTPFALASRLYTGRSDVEAFTPELVADPEVRSLADRVELVSDPEFETRSADGLWGAEVSVRLNDGTRHVATVEDARGGGENPFRKEEVYAKFDSLVGARLSKEATENLRERILATESAESVSDILRPFAAGDQSS